MGERLNKMEDVPCFYAALVMYFPICTSQSELASFFPGCCLFKRYDDFEHLEVTVCEVSNVFCWEVTDVLTQLFEACDLESVAAVRKHYKGSVFIDISFVHKNRYPALVFDGWVMQTIHQLQASIGIDPY